MVVAVRRLSGLLVAGSALLLLLTGCSSSASVSREDLLGEWVNGPTSLALRADGSFEFSAAPSDVVDSALWDDLAGRDPVGSPMDVSGTWKYLPQGDDAIPDPRVVLFYDEDSQAAVSGLSAFTMQEGDGVVLAFPLGDPDRHIFFVLQALSP